MQRKDNMPLWVFLGLMNVETRKGSMILFSACLACGILCIPLSWYLQDWSWAGLTLLCAAWYWLCIRWVDVNAAWE